MKRLRTVVLVLFLVMISGSGCFAGSVTVRILHMNDFHGFAEPYTPYGGTRLAGGVAWLAARVDVLRKEKPTLLLAAGDMIQGNNWANLSMGESVIDLMNLMGFDAMTVGNHEFDFGRAVLEARIAQARFPVLGANVAGLPLLKPYIVREVGGVRVALIGVVTDDTPVSTHPRNVAGLKFSPPAETISRLLAELGGLADVIVVLSHAGYQSDRVLAREVRGIDLIIGGHSHTRIERPTRVGTTMIAQAWEHGKVLGVVDITLEKGKVVSMDGRLEEIKPENGKPDPVVLSLVANYRGKVDAALGARAGEAEVSLDGGHARWRETNLGNLVADIMRSVSGADAALINGGGIRTSIAKGPVLVKDVYDVLPFDNYIVAIRLTGRQLLQALEHGVARAGSGSGAFPQVSGLVFTYDPSAPAGSRVRKVTVGGGPLDPVREYTVATNDFLAAGGDGYASFGDAIKSSRDFAVIGGMLKGEKLVYSDSGRWIRDVVVDWFRVKGKIAPVVEGRIIELR